MSNFLNIDIWRKSVTLSLMIEKGGIVKVYDRPRCVWQGTKEDCVKAIRNFFSLFDGSDKRVVFDLYDGSFEPAGAEVKNYLKSHLMLIGTSYRSKVEVVPHMGNSFD